MFRDSRVLDRQHTATSFNAALVRYANNRETWFDRSVDSVDARLAQCDRLIHSARFTVARLSIADGARYLRAAEDLDADRRSLLALRDDLLTGASYRADVVGPPGWRTASDLDSNWIPQEDKHHRPGVSDHHDQSMEEAVNADWKRFNGSPEVDIRTCAASPTGGAITSPVRLPTAPTNISQKPAVEKTPAGGAAGLPAGQTQKKAFTPPDPPSNINENLKAQWREDQAAGINPTERHLPEHLRQATEYHPPGFDRGDPIYDRPYRGPAPQRGEHHQLSPEATEQTRTMGEGYHGPPPMHLPGHPPLGLEASLAGTDRRWVTLEAAKFIAANSDTLDDSHELATRAHAHAALKTSTFTPKRSAEICRAFVASVVDLGRQTHRPSVVRTAAASVDFSDEAIYLC
jgi:hypothetical protein